MNKTVQPGQVWVDWDSRSRPKSGLTKDARRFLIVERILNDQRAECKACDCNGCIVGNRTYRIVLRRFRPTSTGYKLHREPEAIHE